MMNITERYLGRTMFAYSALVLFVLVSLVGFFDLIYQLGKASGDFTYLKVVLYVTLKLPTYFYELFPIALLIGSLMGLGNLANRGELTILRVTGWSMWRILLALAKTAFLMWLAVAIIGEFIAPKSESLAQKVRVEAQNKNFSLDIGTSQGFWLKDGTRYIHIERIISEREMNKVSIYTLKNGQLQSLQVSDKLIYNDDRGWLMPNGESISLQFVALPGELRQLLSEQETGMTAGQLAVTRLQLIQQSLQQLPIALPFLPEDLVKLDIDSRYLSLYDLYNYIQFLQQNELDASAYESDFWRKLSMPVVAFAMWILAFPLLFASQRQVSIGQRIFIGVVIGLGFQLMNMLISNAALVYQLPIGVVAFVPALLLISFAIWSMRRLP
ncbi:LPS export ABC transporter permease LptG [Thiomicrorhabdus sp. 6S2-11]|uniref:LPS export ABC transporter permease LptG n=1 Tax=Thiomicrorhabdus marina TaxID=2818442 RepID=A0ABS3Q234_9GAMM|nr:LPS export ABC transporter permease LptG [Thiomicrorhabdus marina]MBO1926383.1 LPS export ABC transporter permease LptG [Thiomicrorhabdus marina]